MMRYSILDPTGNITALVESPVDPAAQPEAAREIMRLHPEVEQVGFLRIPETGEVQGELRMAGGEFCGNASMCAAALLHRQGRAAETVRLRISGAALPVEVRLRKTAEGYAAGVRMPRAREIVRREFAFAGLRDTLTLVRMEGISHLAAEPESVFFPLREDRPAAERAVQLWCEELGAEGLGLMFLERGEEPRLTPLVYIPGSGTVFWENSCASGTSAAGMALAKESGAPVDLTLREPGGVLRVRSSPDGETWLYGSVRFGAGE